MRIVAGASREAAQAVRRRMLQRLVRGGGKFNLGEHWFNLETSPVKRRVLFQLEREMDATLTFEHGGGLRASQLWVTRILLGGLFRKRLTLGQAVKSFTKFQCREIMWGLVKLNELEEVVEPPLGGMSESSTLGPPKDEMLDLEEEDTAPEDDNEVARFSPGESQIGLL
jgi:hypothetical protein